VRAAVDSVVLRAVEVAPELAGDLVRMHAVALPVADDAEDPLLVRVAMSLSQGLNVRRVVMETRPSPRAVTTRSMISVPPLRDLRPVGGDLLLRDAGDDLPGELVGAPAPEFAERDCTATGTRVSASSMRAAAIASCRSARTSSMALRCSSVGMSALYRVEHAPIEA